ncbi:MAG TPA: septum formation initiator family protein [Candidatus Binataceae bacterium]|nr:septum formation initiator family protein [Candidatus Binataceae bacterium]
MSKLSNALRRLAPTLILAVATVGLAVDCLKGPMGVRDLIALRQDQTHLEAARDKLMAENESLGRRVESLTSDDRYLERLIRRELGYARSDELVYRFAGSTTDHR